MWGLQRVSGHQNRVVYCDRPARLAYSAESSLILQNTLSSAEEAAENGAFCRPTYNSAESSINGQFCRMLTYSAE